MSVGGRCGRVGWLSRPGSGQGCIDRRCTRSGRPHTGWGTACRCSTQDQTRWSTRRRRGRRKARVGWGRGQGCIDRRCTRSDRLGTGLNTGWRRSTQDQTRSCTRRRRGTHRTVAKARVGWGRGRRHTGVPARSRSSGQGTCLSTACRRSRRAGRRPGTLRRRNQGSPPRFER